MARPLVAVCALVALAGPAHADERRKVAVIDLSADPEAKQLRDALYNALVEHWALRPLDTAGLNDALQGDFVDEDRDGLDTARRKHGEAEDALARFELQPALASASDGEAALGVVNPAQAATACADLAFVAGVAELALKDKDAVALQFAFTHRLDPSRTPDPVRYLPEILDAYRAAATASAPHVHLDVKGTGHVWIDGAARGSAPATFDVETGYHLVQLTAPDRLTRGQIVRVERDTSVVIDTPAAPLELRVKRARKALALLPDDAVARAGAMNQLAELLGVHDAVLIWKRKADRRLLVQTWRDRAPGFSALREHAGEPARDLLEPLSPPRPPEPPHVAVQQPLPPLVPHEGEPPWYQKRWVQASVAGGVVLTVVGAILWARGQGMVTTGSGHPQWLQP